MNSNMTQLPIKDTEKNIQWTPENMEILADCVIDMIIKYNDTNLLINLDGFSPRHENKSDKFANLTSEIIEKLNVPNSKRGAIHSQLSIIGCAYKGKKYNRKKGKVYKKIIDSKLNKLFGESLQFDEHEDIDEELNFPLKIYEGKQTTRVTTIRERNSKARELVLKRDKYTCQCCGLTPIDSFKNILHVHHKKPLHQSKGQRQVELTELTTLCPTCHGYVHSQKETLTIETVKSLLDNSIE